MTGSVPTLTPITAEMMRDAQDHTNVTRGLAWRMAHAVWAHGPPEPVEVDVIPDEPPVHYGAELVRLWSALHEIAVETYDDEVGDEWCIEIARKAIRSGVEFHPGTTRPIYCPPMPEETP